MKLKTVTITGADDSINPSELLTISEQFPYVEWAILLSRSQMGGKRFPHLCGSWLRNLMVLGDSTFIDELALWSNFKRIQLNFHAEPTLLSNKALNFFREQTWNNHKTFIVQMDNVNNDLCQQLLNAGVLAEGLFDISHGAGVLPNEWPSTIQGVNPNAFSGRAGGLGPDNIKEQLSKIETSLEKDTPIWIDMETKVRSNNDEQFDLEKVKKCLEIAEKWICF